MSEPAPEADPEEVPSWVAVLDDVVDEGIDREEALELAADDLSVEVPLRFGTDAPRAEWRFDGTVRVSVDGASGPLADWLQFWHRRTTTAEDD